MLKNEIIILYNIYHNRTLDMMKEKIKKQTKLKQNKIKPEQEAKPKNDLKQTEQIEQIEQTETKINFKQNKIKPEQEANLKNDLKQIEQIEQIEQTDTQWHNFLNEVNNYEEIIDTSEIKNIEYNITELSISPNWNEEENTQYEVVRKKNDICITCNVELIIEKYSYVCGLCGYESKKDTYSDMTSVSANCNVNIEGFVPIRFVGKESRGNQKCLYITSADYSKYRKSNTMKDMKNLNNISEKYHIPKNVIKEACEMFDQIKQKGYVFRKDGKRGVLSACLYYACYNNGISKTPTEIAQFSEIEEKFQSQGDRILHDLNEKGIISIPTKINPIYDYINRYFEILNIDSKYKAFVIDLIKRADEKNIHLLHDNKTNTKAIGSIYILIDRTEYKNKITKEKIEKECGISKTTFIRYCDIIYNYYKLFKRIFKKHKISMPIEWKAAE
jgi:hypothetical protein